jgi:serine/threonine protein kinase
MTLLHQPGDVVRDRYQLVRELGRGSMGTTYEAMDRATGQSVAIKAVSLLATTDWKMLELFEREAQVLSNLDHPLIPNYIDYFHVDSDRDRIFYLAQELAVGRSLQERVEQGWIASEAEAISIATQILHVLCYLHQRVPPVIHRDIKPSNLIYRDDGTVMVVDFGAVRHIYRNTLTLGMTFVGTAGYMPPEQYQGRVRPASDLYSLGATLVFLLSGRSPDRLPQVRMRLNIQPYVTLSPPMLAWLERLLDPVLEDRTPSAQIALDQLQYLTVTDGVPSEPDHHRPTPEQAGQAITHPTSRRIRLKRSPQSIHLSILPCRHHPWVWVAIGALLFLGTPVILGSIVVIVGTFVQLLIGQATFPAFLFSWLILLNPVTVGVIFSLLFLLTHRVELYMDAQTFSLKHWFAGMPYKQRLGATRRIQGVRERQGLCALQYGLVPYPFGGFLDPMERLWIVQELTRFIDQVRSPVDTPVEPGDDP